MYIAYKLMSSFPYYCICTLISTYYFKLKGANFGVLYLYVFKKGWKRSGWKREQCGEEGGLVLYQVIASHTSHPNLVISPKCYFLFQ